MKIYYQNNNGQIINFTAPPYRMLKDTDLLDYSRGFTSRGDIHTKIVGFHRGVVSREVFVRITASEVYSYQEAVGKILEVMEKDVLNLTPGRLYVNDMYLPCFFVGCTKQRMETNEQINKYEVISERGAWIKESPYIFRTDVSLPSTGGKRNLDYPLDFKYDFASSMTGRTINSTGIVPVDFEITFYGACLNPSVNIGGETYRVDVSLDTGEYLKINSITKKIYKVKINGERVNQFYLRDRNPTQFFRKIKPGINAVAWTGAYGVDVTLFEERSEPEWI